MKDELFKKGAKKQFEFDESVASVFDDMIARSVPFYKENLELCTNLLVKLAAKNAKICDLGCASGNFLIELAKLRKDLVLSGVDSAKPMLEIARKKCEAYGVKAEFFECVLDDFAFFKNDVFIATYTLQFIRPPKRQALVDKIYENLNENGIFLMSEKILYEDALLSKKILELYAEYKQKQGYTKFEISTKREALENVLVPYSSKENLTMLKNAGFKNIQSLFKWANFETFIGFR